MTVLIHVLYSQIARNVGGHGHYIWWLLYLVVIIFGGHYIWWSLFLVVVIFGGID